MNENKPTKRDTFLAFISHARVDDAAVDRIVAALEAKGIRCWIDHRDLKDKVGSVWPEKIVEAIEKSSCFVLVLSEAGNLSDEVLREVMAAAKQGIPIYPVRVEDVPFSRRLEYYISAHQWIDAWSGVLDAHIAVLVAAMDKGDDWIGNELLRRRRRWRIGSALALTAAVATIAVATIFSGDIRSLFSTDQERAAEILRDRGISVTTPALAGALSDGSVETLRLLQRAGATNEQIEQALSESAERFFATTRQSTDAEDWVRDVLDNGLDPNLRIRDNHYGSTTILAAALNAGNAGAVLALLDAGATPHVYQDLWLSPYSVPAFLFPFSYLIDNRRFEPHERQAIAQAFQEAGAAVQRIVSDGSSASTTHQIQAVNELMDRAPSELGLTLSEPESACSGRSETPICLNASRQSDRDWCAFMNELPAQIEWQQGRSYIPEITRINVHNLLGVIDNRAYVLGTQNIGWQRDYVLLEISADMINWQVHIFSGPGVGLGHCKALDDGFQPDRCWRRWSMTFRPEHQLMLIENNYQYSAPSTCAP